MIKKNNQEDGKEKNKKDDEKNSKKDGERDGEGKQGEESLTIIIILQYH
jgi:hypothetical protein